AARALTEHGDRVDRAQLPGAHLVGEALFEAEAGATGGERVAVDVAAGETEIDRVIVVDDRVADAAGLDAVLRRPDDLDRRCANLALAVGFGGAGGQRQPGGDEQ